ncbi:MAG: Rrf2 family transcriptional regulator [Acidobacteriia bacterium]|nr:Rrf2 family transcriptional regulator [Terriglobia bacterium]
MNGLPITIRYAIKILIFLSLTAGHSISASELARLTRIPPSQVAKVLHVLRWGGLTRSRRGLHGGYELRMSPEEIHVEQVMKLFLPVGEEKQANAADDPFLQIWTETEARSQQEWKQLTIAELSRRMPEHAADWDKLPASEHS